MQRNLKSPSLCVQFMVFCCILLSFVGNLVFSSAIYAVLSQVLFFAIFALLCGEKFSQKKMAVEKKWKISGMGMRRQKVECVNLKCWDLVKVGTKVLASTDKPILPPCPASKHILTKYPPYSYKPYPTKYPPISRVRIFFRW